MQFEFSHNIHSIASSTKSLQILSDLRYMLVAAIYCIVATITDRSLCSELQTLSYCGTVGTRAPSTKDPSDVESEEALREALPTAGLAHCQVLCYGHRSSARCGVARSHTVYGRQSSAHASDSRLRTVKSSVKNQSPLSPLLRTPRNLVRAGDRRILKVGNNNKHLRLSRSVPCRSTTAGLLVLLTTTGQCSGRKTNWSPVS